VSKKRFVDTSFWSDVWVVDELTQLDRYFFLYLLTNEKTNVAGVYEISVKTMSNETDFTKDDIKSMLSRMESRVRYIDGWIVLRKGIKNQNWRNEKIKKSMDETLRICPPDARKFIDFPSDFDEKKVTSKIQQKIFSDADEMTTSQGGDQRKMMSHSRVMEDSLHLDHDSDSDSDSDSEAGSANPPAGKPGRIKDPKLGKSYARAVRADEALAERAAGTKERKPHQEKKAKTAAEIFAERRKNHGSHPVSHS
jgi:hypothetical protein